MGWWECKPVAHLLQEGWGESSIRLLDGGEAGLWVRLGGGTAASTQPGGVGHYLLGHKGRAASLGAHHAGDGPVLLAAGYAGGRRWVRGDVRGM